MARELKESLMYNCNYNLFLAKTMLPNVRNIEDKQTVLRWLRFLKTSAKTVEEMKLRNDFMYYLVLNVREGVLKPPFDKPPPNMPLMSIATLLPAEIDTETEQPSGSTTKLPHSAPRKRSKLLRRSPDGGEFLLSQPIPDVGAFCYMAVVTRKKK